MVELEFGNVDFCGGRKTGEPGEKPSWVIDRADYGTDLQHAIHGTTCHNIEMTSHCFLIQSHRTVTGVAKYGTATARLRIGYFPPLI
jgi:hypothetical protein